MRSESLPASLAKYAMISCACGLIGYCTGAKYFEPPDPRAWVTEARTELYRELTAQLAVRRRTGQWSQQGQLGTTSASVRTEVQHEGYVLVLKSHHRRVRGVVCELRYEPGTRLPGTPSPYPLTLRTRPTPFPMDGRPYCFTSG